MTEIGLEDDVDPDAVEEEDDLTEGGEGEEGTSYRVMESDRGTIYFTSVTVGPMGSDMLEMIYGQDAYVDFQMLDAAGTVQYAWEFYGMTLNSVEDVTLTLSLGGQPFTGLDDIKAGDTAYLYLDQEGELPGPASLFLLASDYFTEDDIVTLYQYIPAASATELSSDAENGITISTLSASMTEDMDMMDMSSSEGGCCCCSGSCEGGCDGCAECLAAMAMSGDDSEMQAAGLVAQTLAYEDGDQLIELATGIDVENGYVSLTSLTEGGYYILTTEDLSESLEVVEGSDTDTTDAQDTSTSGTETSSSDDTAFPWWAVIDGVILVGVILAIVVILSVQKKRAKKAEGTGMAQETAVPIPNAPVQAPPIQQDDPPTQHLPPDQG